MKRLLFAAASLTMFAACSDTEDVLQNDKVKDEGRLVTVTTTLPGETPDSRVTLTEENADTDSRKIAVKWKESGETFSVMTAASTAAQTFTQTKGSNEFTGTLTEGWTQPYYAFYPVTSATNATAVPYDISTQTGTLSEATNYMYAVNTTDGKEYNFQHLTAIVKFTLNLPSGYTPTSLSLVSDRLLAKGTVNLTGDAIEYTNEQSAHSITVNNLKVTEGKITLYLHVSPMAASDDSKNILYFRTNDGSKEYSGSISTSKEIKAGKYYTATVNIFPYVTFTATSEQTMKITTSNNFDLGEKFQYSVDGSTWATLAANTDVTFGGDNGILLLRGKSSSGTATSIFDYAKITFGNNNIPVACSGDIRTLVDWENYTTSSTADARFCYLFNNCKSLTSAPALPATTLAENCYYSMFKGCITLTTAPHLPATTLAGSCYFAMFQQCSALTAAPQLSATTLAVKCYSGMFRLCSSLTAAPQLPATILENSCYNGMFQDCNALTTAPELPATTLTQQCYYNMFCGCSALSSVTMLATNINAANCLFDWLQYAGKIASTKTVYVANSDMKDAVKMKCPNDWTVTAVEE